MRVQMRVQSIKMAYTKNHHNKYMKMQSDRGSLSPVIYIYDVNEEGISMNHGWSAGKREGETAVHLPIQDEYETMIHWIIDTAEKWH